MRALISYGLMVAALPYALYQVRKPGKWGASHSALTDWGLKHVAIRKDFRILDVGCGGGRTIEKLAAFAAVGV